jgi:hypothetical protein
VALVRLVMACQQGFSFIRRLPSNRKAARFWACCTPKLALGLDPRVWTRSDEYNPVPSHLRSPEDRRSLSGLDPRESFRWQECTANVDEHQRG